MRKEHRRTQTEHPTCSLSVDWPNRNGPRKRTFIAYTLWAASSAAPPRRAHRALKSAELKPRLSITPYPSPTQHIPLRSLIDAVAPCFSVSSRRTLGGTGMG